MANKKVNKIVKNKKPVKPAKKANKVVKPQNKTAPKKQVKVQKVKVNSIPQAVVTESKKTYNIFGYEVKKSHVWIAVAVIVLLLITAVSLVLYEIHGVAEVVGGFHDVEGQARDVAQQEIEAEKAASFEALSIAEHVAMFEDKGMSRKEAMKAVAAERGISKRDVYNALLKEEEPSHH